MKNRRKAIFILIHVLFWIFELSREYFYWDQGVDRSAFYSYELLTAVIFYINFYFLVPKTIKLNNNWTFLYWFLIYIAFSGFILSLWRTYLGIIEVWNFETFVKQIAFYTHVSFYYGGIGLALRLAQDWLKNQEDTENLILKKTTIQLQFMKSNVNIPFMVNVLEEAQKEAEVDPEHVEEPILQLSSVLRYGLYESHDDTVELSKELEVLTDYIALVNFTKRNLYLTLDVKVEDLSVMTLPNFIVKVIGYWVNNSGIKIEGEKYVSLSGNKDVLKLVLPFKEGEEIHGFPSPVSKFFVINYLKREGFLEVRVEPTIKLEKV